MVIKNVKIVTMTGRDYENGFVRFDDKIIEIGDMNDFSPMIEEEIDGT